jgi:hypothetical protein
LYGQWLGAGAPVEDALRAVRTLVNRHAASQEKKKCTIPSATRIKETGTRRSRNVDIALIAFACAFALIVP